MLITESKYDETELTIRPLTGEPKLLGLIRMRTVSSYEAVINDKEIINFDLKRKKVFYSTTKNSKEKVEIAKIENWNLSDSLVDVLGRIYSDEFELKIESKFLGARVWTLHFAQKEFKFTPRIIMALKQRFAGLFTFVEFDHFRKDKLIVRNDLGQPDLIVKVLASLSLFSVYQYMYDTD